MKKPGNLFLRIICRDYKGYQREMFALIVCEAVFLALLFTCAASYQKFTKAYSSDHFILFQEGDAGSMFVSAGVFLLFSGMIVTMTVLVSYLRKRMPDYILLKRIGIRGKDIRSMILAECGMAYSFSVIIGFVLGIALCRGLEIILSNTIHENVKPGNSAWFTYPVICACVLIIFLLGFAFLMELEGDFFLITGGENASAGEKLTGRFTVPVMLTGILISIVSAVSYRKLYNHENTVYIVLFLFGLFLAGRNLSAIILFREKRDRPDRYYSRITLNNRFYFRIGTISRYVLIYSVLSVVTCFYMPLQIATIIHSENAGSLFPYDFVCIADENDDDLIGDLKAGTNADITEYPMVRVTTALKTERIGSAADKPIQGQQIGISESTYHSLKKAADDDYIKRDLYLDENGENVYIVHQQDRSVKAQPVDWYYGKARPNLHIGLPCEHADYFNGNTSFYEKKPVGEEIGSLIGCYSTEKNENIIVMSDKAFIKARDKWKETDALTGLSDESARAYFGKDDPEYEPLHIEGPTKLILIKVDPENYGYVDTILQDREPDHMYIGNYDSTVKFHYSSETAIRDIKTSRTTRMMLSLCMMTAFLLMKALILYAMCQMEREERCRRDRFFASVGTSVKLRKKIVRRELLVYYVIPLVVMCITAAVFSSGSYTARMYSPEFIEKCVRNQLAIAVLLEISGLLYFGVLCKAEERGIGISDE